MYLVYVNTHTHTHMLTPPPYTHMHTLAHNKHIHIYTLSKKRSKSLSPLVLARISPFSQAVNSRSWSTFYSEEFSFGKNFEPLLPQVCLRLLWRESDNGLSRLGDKNGSLWTVCVCVCVYMYVCLCVCLCAC